MKVSMTDKQWSTCGCSESFSEVDFSEMIIVIVVLSFLKTVKVTWFEGSQASLLEHVCAATRCVVLAIVLFYLWLSMLVDVAVMCLPFIGLIGNMKVCNRKLWRLLICSRILQDLTVLTFFSDRPLHRPLLLTHGNMCVFDSDSLNCESGMAHLKSNTFLSNVLL